jgi:hypothetical protein
MPTIQRAVCIGTVFLLFFCFVDLVAQEQPLSGELPLERMTQAAGRQTKLRLSAEADRQSYEPGAVLELTVMVRNVTTGPINIYGAFTLGFGSSFEIHIFDDSGRCFVPSIMFESMVGIPDDNRDFVKLQGKHFLGTSFHLPLERFDMGPGKYTIVLEYHSPFWRSEDVGVEVWPREFGSIYSQPTEIEVVSAK